MGTYWKWVNEDRKEFISPRDFDDNAKFPVHGCAKALFEMMALENWGGCRISVVPDTGDHPTWEADEGKSLGWKSITDSYLVSYDEQGAMCLTRKR